MVGKLTKAQRRAWARRAQTIHRKAEDLLSDMIDALGVEHEGTDFADNVTCETASLVAVLTSDRYDMWAAGRAALEAKED